MTGAVSINPLRHSSERHLTRDWPVPDQLGIDIVLLPLPAAPRRADRYQPQSRFGPCPDRLLSWQC
ncbi:MAG: hypothetical protein ACRENX_02770 [Candidatus Dormibacteria bacterium]